MLTFRPRLAGFGSLDHEQPVALGTVLVKTFLEMQQSLRYRNRPEANVTIKGSEMLTGQT